jgi:hypothetical protein
MLGAAISVVTAIVSAGALAITSSNCAAGVSFELSSPSAQPSSYCEATHFPGLPDSISSALIVGAVFFTPIAIAIAGTLIASQRRSWTPMRIATGVAALTVC